MRDKTFNFKDQDGVKIFVYKWLPDPKTRTEDIVQISHGAAEHTARYVHVADNTP